jgi:hypothetical protein
MLVHWRQLMGKAQLSEDGDLREMTLDVCRVE